MTSFCSAKDLSRTSRYPRRTDPAMVCVKKTENGSMTYYLRSSVFAGQVVAEIVGSGTSWSWNRGYVYSGSGLLAVQSANSVSWVHEDPITKSKRITNSRSEEH